MIELLVGIPGSGKSTYALDRAKEGAVTVNRDAITAMVHGGDYTAYTKDWKDFYPAVESEIIRLAIIRRLDVVVDATNINVERRARLLSEFSVVPHKIATVFIMDTGIAKKLRSQDTKGYPVGHWDAVIDRFESQFEIPTLAEGFTEVRFVQMKTVKGKMEVVDVKQP